MSRYSFASPIMLSGVFIANSISCDQIKPAAVNAAAQHKHGNISGIDRRFQLIDMLSPKNLAITTEHPTDIPSAAAIKIIVTGKDAPMAAKASSLQIVLL